MKRLWPCLFLLLCAVAQAGRPPSPFVVKVAVATNDGASVVRFQFAVPPEHVIYAERLHFENANGDELTPSKIPTPVIAVDKATGHEKRMFQQPFAVELKLDAPLPLELLVKFQGCSNSACYFPEKHRFTVTPEGVAEVAPASPPAELAEGNETLNSDWSAAAKQFKVVGKRTGYVKSDDFISFLKRAAAGDAAEEDSLLARYKSAGLIVTLFLIVLGGVGLNLTPCVLPLIPINLAIIGAGKAAHSRREGFLHGTTYGLGMALAYGALGLVVVLTGAKFGTLNSSVWFNVIIAAIFVVLALAMFDVYQIDFTRFDKALGRRESHAAHQTKKRWLVAFTLGAIAALLAGACVAPVVISVLLLATNLYGKGVVIGLALPFLLGAGMALPWPFMGASLSFLPKPGKWMTRVKQGFGVLIFIFAVYYGHLAYGLFQSRRATVSLAAAPESATLVAAANQTLIAALRESRETGKPVFLDFQASWCKNCEAMDATVFNQARVRENLQHFVSVKYPAERPNDSPAREVLDHFGVMGLPTYVVLSPKK
jgi:thioredoxin:protein disulfide reductase